MLGWISQDLNLYTAKMDHGEGGVNCKRYSFPILLSFCIKAIVLIRFTLAVKRHHNHRNSSKGETYHWGGLLF